MFISSEADRGRSINRLQTDNELESIRESVNKNKPFGNHSWLDKIVKKFGLEMTLRKPGRPKNGLPDTFYLSRVWRATGDTTRTIIGKLEKPSGK